MQGAEAAGYHQKGKDILPFLLGNTLKTFLLIISVVEQRVESSENIYVMHMKYSLPTLIK